MTTQASAEDWKEMYENAAREARQWRSNFETLQQALVGNTGASGIEAAATYRKLLQDIEANMRRAWNDRTLSAEAWPTDLAQRLSKALHNR